MPTPQELCLIWLCKLEVFLLSFRVQYGSVKAKTLCQSQLFDEPHTPPGKQATRSVSSEKDAKDTKDTKQEKEEILN